jgi:5-formyltetrahydrofolate cyclo-ligase
VAKRRALDDDARREGAAAVAARAKPLLERATSVGAYVAVRGEVDPAPLVEWAWSVPVPVFVPRLTAGRAMVFAAWNPGAPTQAGEHGIPEPPAEATIRAAGRIDAVLVPLVAFDRTGTRLGTGEGYYDRAFEFRRHQPRGTAPLLIGLAYAWQEVDVVERRAWDIPLDYIVTDAEVIQARG